MVAEAAAGFCAVRGVLGVPVLRGRVRGVMHPRRGHGPAAQ